MLFIQKFILSTVLFCGLLPQAHAMVPDEETSTAYVTRLTAIGPTVKIDFSIPASVVRGISQRDEDRFSEIGSQSAQTVRVENAVFTKEMVDNLYYYMNQNQIKPKNLILERCSVDSPATLVKFSTLGFKNLTGLDNIGFMIGEPQVQMPAALPGMKEGHKKIANVFDHTTGPATSMVALKKFAGREQVTIDFTNASDTTPGTQNTSVFEKIEPGTRKVTLQNGNFDSKNLSELFYYLKEARPLTNTAMLNQISVRELHFTNCKAQDPSAIVQLELLKDYLKVPGTTINVQFTVGEPETTLPPMGSVLQNGSQKLLDALLTIPAFFLTDPVSRP